MTAWILSHLPLKMEVPQNTLLTRRRVFPQPPQKSSFFCHDQNVSYCAILKPCKVVYCMLNSQQIIKITLFGFIVLESHIPLLFSSMV